jgi:glycosyltransferase involved in cell wall biosynthesis
MRVHREPLPANRTQVSIDGLLEESLNRLGRWVEHNQYRAYDPGDGQMSFLRALTFGSRTLERALTAAVLRSPFNVRPLIGIKPHTSTKGMAYMAWGYLRRFQATGKPHYAERARICLDWLMSHGSPGYSDLCWGNEFTFTTRAGRIPRHQPTIVWSGLIGETFVDAFETLGDHRYLLAAASTCDWILKLPRERTSSGVCLSYVAFDQVSIHNSNMLGAALLARVGALTGRQEATDLAREAMLYSCARQNSDGAWFYGEAPKYHWIDSFHTGYNLDSLKRYTASTNDTELSRHLSRGYQYFKRTFFEPDGRTRYMHDRLLPIDIQCAAQAIDTLSFFADADSDALDLAARVALWTIEHMQAPAGFFYYRVLSWKTVRTPMLHWGQGTMFKALAHLLAQSHGAAGTTAAVPARPVGTPLSYVLITPARNEEALIGDTIRSVVQQTHRPLLWVIVSDGSTDATDDIVRSYAKDFDWIEFLRMPEHQDRQFGAKANAFNAGYERMRAMKFDIIGNLDADITFDPHYLEFLVGQFANDPELGVAGTPFVEDGSRPDHHTYSHDRANLAHVSGACQMFRRECFEAVGGYVPIPGGAIDWIAVTTARMKGWRTRTFLEKVCYHHRKIGTGNSGQLMVRFHYGRKAYYVGGHPLWELARGIFQMRTAPVAIGGLFFIAGYLWAGIARTSRPVSPELMSFHRQEQLTRLRRLLRLPFNHTRIKNDHL